MHGCFTQRPTLRHYALTASGVIGIFLFAAVHEVGGRVSEPNLPGAIRSRKQPAVVLAKLTPAEKAEKARRKEKRRQEKLKRRQQKLEERERKQREKELGIYKPNKLIVDISATPETSPVEGEVNVAIKVKSDGKDQSVDVVVEAAIPNGTEFLKCSASNNGACQTVGGKVIASFPVIKARKTVNVNVLLKMPPDPGDVKLNASANGEFAFQGNGSETIRVVPLYARAILLPSLRQTSVDCGDTLDSGFFGADHTVQLIDPLSCPGVPYAILVTASGKTVDLNKMTVIGTSIKGNVGVLIGAGATDVTVDGGSTRGSSGIEHFDYCLRDEGGNAGLEITNLRCFRARSAGFAITSDDVTVHNSLVDRTTPKSGATAGPPGGVGIWASGDNIYIDGTIVRRSENVGILSVGNNLTINNCKIEKNFGIGLYLNGENNLADRVRVRGDGADTGTSMDGVVVGPDAKWNELNHLKVTHHSGNGIVLEGEDNLVEGSTVENVGVDGYVLKGSGNVLNGNKVSVEGNGYVNQGPDNTLTSNTAEQVGGSGYVVTPAGARAVLEGNESKLNALHGYVFAGDDGFAGTNNAEKNAGTGFVVLGKGNNIDGNDSKLNVQAGYEITGQLNLLDTNSAEQNGGYEYVIGPGNSGNGNKSNGDRIFITGAGGMFE